MPLVVKDDALAADIDLVVLTEELGSFVWML